MRDELQSQAQVAEELKAFLCKWGLKGKFVADVCNISEQTLSRFANHRLVLPQNQLIRLTHYMSDYSQRNKF